MSGRNVTTTAAAIVAFANALPAFGSVTAGLAGLDPAAAIEWLNGIENSQRAGSSMPSGSPTGQDSGLQIYSTTEGNLQFTDPITSIFSVWGDNAELDILGIGAIPTQLSLIALRRGGRDSFFTFDVPPGDLNIVTGDADTASYYTFSATFSVAANFQRAIASAESSGELVLAVDGGSGDPDTYIFRAAAVPEPGVSTLLGTTFAALIWLRTNRHTKPAQPPVSRREAR